MAVAALPGVNSDIIAAEIALQRGDCASAAPMYVSAANAGRDLRLAARATEVTLDCGQSTLAVQAATRWRALAPKEANAVLAVAIAELARAHIAEARSNYLAFLNLQPAPDDVAVMKSIDQMVAAAGSDPTLAVLRGVQHARLAGGPVQLQLAELAADGWDFTLALKYADTAAHAGASVGDIAALRIRAEAGLGDADSALSEARALARSNPEAALAEAEALIELGREQEATAMLEEKRLDPRVSLLAERRLALLAFARSDYDTAEQGFTDLVRNQNTAALGVYYLALIAERRGDNDAALRAYDLLARSGFDNNARRRVAGIYMHDGERAQAIRLLAADDDSSTRDRISAELNIAELLASEADAKESVKRLDGALESYPDHPAILYQRAVYQERVDPNAAIASLESQFKQRPADMNLANALGFTLADHNRDLPRAEQLVRMALHSQPDNPAVLDSLGWVLHKRGQPKLALPFLQRAFTLLHDGDIGAHAGEVLWALGRKDEARAQWTVALAADPNNATLKAVTAKYVPGLTAPKPAPAAPNGSGTAI
jgi:tetratricopeptide (TPR) repeat protein